MTTTTCQHDWNHRGFCEDCGAPQPDYEPDDANMPNLAHNTDCPDSTTYPWNSPQWRRSF